MGDFPGLIPLCLVHRSLEAVKILSVGWVEERNPAYKYSNIYNKTNTFTVSLGVRILLNPCSLARILKGGLKIRTPQLIKLFRTRSCHNYSASNQLSNNW